MKDDIVELLYLQSWKDKYVAHFISLAGVWAGTTQAVRVNNFLVLNNKISQG